MAADITVLTCAARLDAEGNSINPKEKEAFAAGTPCPEPRRGKSRFCAKHAAESRQRWVQRVAAEGEAREAKDRDWLVGVSVADDAAKDALGSVDDGATGTVAWVSITPANSTLLGALRRDESAGLRVMARRTADGRVAACITLGLAASVDAGLAAGKAWIGAMQSECPDMLAKGFKPTVLGAGTSTAVDPRTPAGALSAKQLATLATLTATREAVAAEVA